MSTSRQVWVVCDECGARSDSWDQNSLQARLVAIDAGWVHAGLGLDFCPDHKPISKRPPQAAEPDALW